VAERWKQGDLQLHGWVYDLGEGVVTAYDPGQDAFVALQASMPRA
jgi:carbonic anhydrase